jgi:magnesium transporter
MNERQEQTADVLGKLTVLGTIVLPLNIICGMWGMNVKVPGQDVDSLTWFYSSTNTSSLQSDLSMANICFQSPVV